MDDFSLWVLIFAGGAIGLLGVFLAASERELKKMRREVETLVAQLENGPKTVTLDNPIGDPSADTNAATKAGTNEQELQDRIACLTAELEASRKSADELRNQEDTSKSEQTALVELRATNQRLEGEIAHLKAELQSAAGRINALDDGQNAAHDRSRLENVIADLQNQLETRRAGEEELAAARLQLTEYKSRETTLEEEQKHAQARIRELQQELSAANEATQNLRAIHDRATEMERLYRNAKDEIRRLEEECSRWQERVSSGEDQKRRAALRQHLDELQSKQAALIERHRQFQNGLSDAIRLLEVPPEAVPEAAAAPSLPPEPEARPFPLTTAHANGETTSNGNRDNYEAFADPNSPAASAGMSPMISPVDPSNAVLEAPKKRRFGFFPG